MFQFIYGGVRGTVCVCSFMYMYIYIYLYAYVCVYVYACVYECIYLIVVKKHIINYLTYGTCTTSI
jgi:hypothetical protein